MQPSYQQQAYQNKYLEASVQTATPAQLLIMLYDGAIRFCRIAIESIKSKKYDEANKYLMKVQDIVKEFIITLDKDSEVAKGLLPLYDYFIYRLVEANLTKKTEPAEEILQYLIELRETWVQAARIVNQMNAGVKHG